MNIKPRKWDVFISHASEDKEGIARPLAEKLRSMGLRVWYDEFTLQWGRSLRTSVDEGLRNSSYGVVILSKIFFQKEWTKKELDSLIMLMTKDSKILPLRYNITQEEVEEISPLLSGIFSRSWGEGIEKLAKEIRDLVDEHEETLKKENTRKSELVQEKTPVQSNREVFLDLLNKNHIDEFNKIRAKNNFEKLDLRDVLLKDLNLRGANFQNIDFTNVDLTNSDCTGADFSKCIMSNSILQNTKLFSAKLNRAKLDNAKLIKADLRESDLEGADLTKSVLTNAILSGAVLTGVMAKQADFSGSTFKGADLSYSNLHQANFTNADMQHANLRHARRFRTNFKGANLKNTFMDR